MTSYRYDHEDMGAFVADTIAAHIEHEYGVAITKPAITQFARDSQLLFDVPETDQTFEVIVRERVRV